MGKTFSAAEVNKHKSAESAWTIVDGGVYDVTEFLEDHPGIFVRLAKILLNSCGKDSSDSFWKFHSKKILTKTAAKMLIGSVEGQAKL
ncbi:BQ5605_C012g06997 [Microbotryum silenes-dioicae]|uniref:BQ5605_C012g06997 protein n=1 Tax=Microbotryum silenes-dioicae TaxID=796604 RepID=A0A2X0ME38_9BASI|nr:BQ5605_C012g06997 [Microbotryum silenes-dioicae]